MLFVRLFDLRLFGFVCFLFLLVSVEISTFRVVSLHVILNFMVLSSVYIRKK